MSKRPRPRFDEHQRIAAYVTKLKEPVVAIFDVGTRACRVIVAPKQVPEKWTTKNKKYGTENTFCMDGEAFNLGLDFQANNNALPLDSRSLLHVIDFIKGHVKNLQQLGVDRADISLIGTAVFRWLHNQEAVLGLIKKETGFELGEISSPFEAELALRAIPQIHKRHSGYQQPIQDEDWVAVIDQGGGSLEVAWMKWSERNSDRPRIRAKCD